RKITLTVGGNDVGFIAVAEMCASDPSSCETAIATAAAALPTMGQNLAGLLAAVHAQAPQATIYVTGYPHVFQPSMTSGCVSLPTIPAGALFAADAAVDSMNSVIQQAAVMTGAVYVDVDMPEGICTAPNGYIAATWDGGVPLHPTAAGQAVYAAAIEAAGFDD
ncbi:GDSL-type esterase/lipase family protein, partial [Tessaracoccus lapidicaptus]|uniref:GDSL-type esterase/lipase family protein n=1 Tax=Tessaracoccus lapidicaptus TaxID=1427523 RepID=UPI00333E6E65